MMQAKAACLGLSSLAPQAAHPEAWARQGMCTHSCTLTPSTQVTLAVSNTLIMRRQINKKVAMCHGCCCTVLAPALEVPPTTPQPQPCCGQGTDWATSPTPPSHSQLLVLPQAQLAKQRDTVVPAQSQTGGQPTQANTPSQKTGKQSTNRHQQPRRIQ